MGIIAWIIFGLIAGAIARFIMPGKQPVGLFATILVGVGGAVVGGLIGTQLGFGKVSGFNFGSFAIAVVGALVLLYAYQLLRNR
jgi:uncharacterized membrane protein YeaQ/YmgE (transglycosylase-associated protein family)